jgi:NAD(P)-dependent dehydrogenase (short-subunit alcohol dehydrogenase family)
MPGHCYCTLHPVAANKGIGYEIARLLAEAGMTVVLTSRSAELGQAALAKLQAAPGARDGGCAQRRVQHSRGLWPEWHTR